MNKEEIKTESKKEYCLTCIPQPKVKLWYVGGNMFSINKNDATIDTREELLKIQNKFLEQQLETNIEIFKGE